MDESGSGGDASSARHDAPPLVREPPQNPWAQNPWAVDVGVARFARDRFFVNRKVLSLGNKYLVYDEMDRPLFFIDRPVFALKSQFTVYEDESKANPLISVNQESALTVINSSFIVQDAEGRTIGWLRRQGWQSFLRRVWHVVDAREKQIALAMEDSLPKAILRRLVGERGLIGMLVRTNFIFVRENDREVPFGEFNRRLTLTDKHILDLSNDPERTFDRRLALALAIVLDNSERQQ